MPMKLQSMRMDIDPDFVRELAEMLDSNGLSEIEVQDKNRRIRVVRGPLSAASAAASATSSHAASAMSSHAASAMSSHVANYASAPSVPSDSSASSSSLVSGGLGSSLLGSGESVTIPASTTASAASTPAEKGIIVRSPMVGTAYLSAEPGAPLFAAAGSSIESGDTIIIIEAMKVMNPITAPKSGVLSIIYVENSQPVEFDQPLFTII